jgi:hypothetical protein
MLGRGAAEGNQWRTKHDEMPDLSRAGLRAFDLSGFDLIEASEGERGFESLSLQRGATERIKGGPNWSSKVNPGRTRPIARELAERDGVTRRYVRRLVYLAFLSPDLVEAILPLAEKGPPLLAKYKLIFSILVEPP